MNKLKIFLTKGKGEGITKDSAYCEALNKAGLINLNLIHLTSVLPHHCQVINKKPKFSYQDYGKRVYVIISVIKTSKIGETICAGLGWIEKKRSSGYGLVVQLQGNNEEKLKREIRDSLNEIIRFRKEKYKSKKINIVTEKITCKNKPVCALVALTFDKIEGWFN
jgi:arginine decarboxylase